MGQNGQGLHVSKDATDISVGPCEPEEMPGSSSSSQPPYGK
jgi:hypothetical protein